MSYIRFSRRSLCGYVYGKAEGPCAEAVGVMYVCTLIAGVYSFVRFRILVMEQRANTIFVIGRLSRLAISAASLHFLKVRSREERAAS